MTLQPRQLPLNIQLQQSARFSNYITHKNRDVVGQLQTLLDTQENFIFLCGPHDSGRSHLLFAICNRSTTPHNSVTYLPLAQHSQMQTDVMDGLETQHIVCLDDIDAICGNRDWEVALFNLINRMQTHGGTLVITATQTPRNLSIDLPDLRSRLSAGVLLQIQNEDDETKMAILQHNAAERGLQLSREVCNYLISHYQRDLGSLITRLDELDQASFITQRRLTIPFIKEWFDRDAID